MQEKKLVKSVIKAKASKKLEKELESELSDDLAELTVEELKSKGILNEKRKRE